MFAYITGKAPKKIKNTFWLGVLVGALYLFIFSTNQIVDGYYMPNKKDGVYLFTTKPGKKYKIEISGCKLQILIDGIEYNSSPYTKKYCPDGKDITFHKNWKVIPSFHKDVISPKDYLAIAVLVIKTKDGKIIKKMPLKKDLYIKSDDFPSETQIYLYINLSIHEIVIGGAWHVTIDEI